MTRSHHAGRRARLARPRHARQEKNGAASRRLGTMAIEAIVALTLLTTVLSVATPLVVRHGRLLADQRGYRLGLDELSNQLDRLSALPREKLAASLQQLQPSELTARSLPNATLSGQLDAAEIGVRLTLRLSWGDPQRRTPPLTLVTWVLPTLSETTDATQRKESP
ncbi:MAG: hypothetical protein ACC645_13445 [Pirellulales bacterium]